MKGLKHAFSLGPAGPAEPTDEQRAVIDRLARHVARRRLTTPALFMLEMLRPLNYLGSQAIHYFTPIISALTDRQGYRHLARFLEHRESVDYICRRIEEVEAEYERREKQPAAAGGDDADE